MPIENARTDQNYRTTIMGVDMSTGTYATNVYVDESTHRLLTNAIISGTPDVNIASPATIGHGVKTVTSAGTDEALAGLTTCKKVTIQAQTDNTGWIAVGGSGVDATVATGTGVLLGAGDSFELEITDLSSIYIDATVSGDGVRYAYFN